MMLKRQRRSRSMKALLSLPSENTDFPYPKILGALKECDLKRGNGGRQEGMNLSRPVWAVEEKKDDHRLEAEWW